MTARRLRYAARGPPGGAGADAAARTVNIKNKKRELCTSVGAETPEQIYGIFIRRIIQKTKYYIYALHIGRMQDCVKSPGGT